MGCACIHRCKYAYAYMYTYIHDLEECFLSPNGSGIPAQYPRISGQWPEYTEAQLVAYRSGERKNSVQMSAIASRMSDAEIKAVADYIAGLR